MKQCFKCKQIKPLREFYKHSQMGDGYLNKCKECAKQDAHHYRYGPKRNYVLEYDRTRKGGRHIDPSYTKHYRECNPEKYKAHQAAQRIPICPCEQCGSTEYIHRHHDDYNKPKVVRFLCAACHRQYHVRLSFDN